MHIFVCVGVIRDYHQIYFELDAAAYIIGISVKNWVRQCLLSVDGWCMGSIMLWFAFGFVMSDALFSRFFSVITKYRSNWMEHHDQKLQMHSKRIK